MSANIANSANGTIGHETTSTRPRGANAIVLGPNVLVREAAAVLTAPDPDALGDDATRIDPSLLAPRTRP